MKIFIPNIQFLYIILMVLYLHLCYFNGRVLIVYIQYEAISTRPILIVCYNPYCGI